MLASAESEPSLTLRCPRPSIQAGAMNQVLSPQSRGLLIGRLARVAFLLIPVFPAAVAEPPQASPIANFTDVAEKAGLTMTTVFGGKDSKKYIIETTGTGVAIFDYDNDGWKDLYVTYYGKNRLYHNQEGVFTEVAEGSGVAGTGKTWGTGCAFVDYDRDGLLDLMVANYVDFDVYTAPAPGERASCVWKGVPVMCGPRGLPGAKNILYHNLGGGKFEDVTARAKIDQTSGHYGFSVSTLDYDDDGWPDIYVACDSTASILYHNNHDGTFTDRRWWPERPSTRMGASKPAWAR